MKGGAQWYVRGTEPEIAGDVLFACKIAGLSLANHRTGAITYLSAEPGREGDQIATTEAALATFSGSVQLWLGDADVVCTIGPVPRWKSTLFDFSFDGMRPREAREVASILDRAQTRVDHPTVLWLVDYVGFGVEYGPAHTWDGTHAPAWPAPPSDELPERIQRYVSEHFDDPERAVRVLREWRIPYESEPPNERKLAAVVLVAQGHTDRLEDGIRIAAQDWRDLLVAGGVANRGWSRVIDTHFGV